MLVFLVVVYVLGCIVFGPVFGHAEQDLREDVPRAMLATVLWPVIVICAIVGII